MDNPPAFPCTGEGYANPYYTQYGMTLRDWFAGQVANGMAAFSGTQGAGYGPGDIAIRSYDIADAMLEVRKQKEETTNA